MIGLATGPGALFGYLNNAFNRANNATQRMFDNRDTLEDQRMRSIAGDLTFEPATITPVEQAIQNAGNIQSIPYTGLTPGLDLSNMNELDLSNMQMQLGITADGKLGPETQNAYNNWVSQNKNFVTPNNAPINNVSSLPQDKLGQAGAEYAYGRSGRQDDNPYNSPNITVEQGLANSLASQAPAEVPVTQYKAEGGDMPLNPTEYRERIAQNYSSTYGIPIGLARQRVDESGIFTKGRFMDSVERPQLELSNQIGEILRDQNFQQPDEIENFMINSGLLNLALRTGPYGQKLIPRYPQFTFDLGNEDYSNIIYGE